MFSDKFFQNVLVCFTHFKNDQTSIEERKREFSASEDQIINEFQSQFLKVFKTPLSPH
jgi:hypothetical protein